MPRC